MVDTYRLEDAWIRELRFSLSGSFWQRPKVLVRANEQVYPVRHLGSRMGRHRFSVELPLDELQISSFAVEKQRGADSTELVEEEERSALLFEHNADTLLEKVQRRGALTNGKGMQLACALQAYLWAVSAEGDSALSDREERLRARAVPLCSAAYRMIQVAKKTQPGDVALLRQRADEALHGVDLDGPEARWFPSLRLAVAQLCLVKGDVPACLEYLQAIVDEQERILRAVPICAFNVTLAACLLCAILDQAGDPRFETYRDRWQWVFRYYPAHMDIRFGTMEEFGKIYEGAMLNYRIELTRKGHADRRFEPATFDEVLATCMRVKLNPAETRRVRRLVASYAKGAR